MSSHALPFPLRQTRGKIHLGVGTGLLSLRTAFFAIIAVLILFRWLNLILALEITRTGRQIQTSTQELRRVERYNSRLRLAIAEAESPSVLAGAAKELGFRPATPEYLRVDEPLAPRSGESGVGSPLFVTLGSAQSSVGEGPIDAGTW